MDRKILLCILLVTPLLAFSQKKADRMLTDNLKRHTDQLLADSGGKQNQIYLENQFRELGTIPGGENGTYLQAMVSDAGKKFSPGTSLSLNNQSLAPGIDFIPLSYSAQGVAQGEPLVAVQERKLPWIMDISNYLGDTGQPDDSALRDTLYHLAAQAVQDQASAVIFYNSLGNTKDLSFNPAESYQPLHIPVLYINNLAAKKYLKDPTSSIAVALKVVFSENRDTSYNMVAQIDHQAPNTIIIAARQPADEAVAIELARILKSSRQYARENYLIVAFGGPSPNQGISGPAYFFQHLPIPRDQVNCILELSGTGRMNPGTPALRLQGTGSSPDWKGVLGRVKMKELQISTDADPGTGASSSIPGLTFSGPGETAPEDTADELPLLRYLADIIGEVNRKGRLSHASAVSDH